MMEIHGVAVSVHTRKVIVAALEKGLEYRSVPVIPYNPPPGWDGLSPTGRIPVLRDGDWVLPDSSAICAYLERRYPAAPLYPSQPREYGNALWFEQYAGGALFREVVHGLFFQKVIRPGMLKQETDTAVVRSILDDALPPVFGYLDSALGAEFLAGSRFSIADIATVSNLINFHYLGYSIDAVRFPRLAAYFRRQIDRPSIARALADEGQVAAAMGLDAGFVHYLGLVPA